MMIPLTSGTEQMALAKENVLSLAMFTTSSSARHLRQCNSHRNHHHHHHRPVHHLHIACAVRFVDFLGIFHAHIVYLHHLVSRLLLFRSVSSSLFLLPAHHHTHHDFHHYHHPHDHHLSEAVGRESSTANTSQPALDYHHSRLSILMITIKIISILTI